MDQIKAFISHSSDDALYVDVLINLIGKNSLVVDRFCFESGERTIDEIIKSHYCPVKAGKSVFEIVET